MSYKKNGSKTGLAKLNATSATIATAEGYGTNSMAVGHFGCTIKNITVSGATTTDTTIKFYSGVNLMKTLTSASGLINSTAEVRLEKNGINKITLTTTGNHATAGLAWGIQYAAE